LDEIHLLETFSELSGDFRLKQTDKEGDEITIGTDRELKIALTPQCMVSQCRYPKLIVAPISLNPLPPPTPSTNDTSSTIQPPILRNTVGAPPKPIEARKIFKNGRGKKTFTAWVGGVGRHVTGMHLRKLFGHQFPSVVAARVVSCPMTGHSRFGFVEFTDVRERDQAIKVMDGEFFLCSQIKVRDAPNSADRRRGHRSKPGVRDSKNLDDRFLDENNAQNPTGLAACEIHADPRPLVGKPKEILTNTWTLLNCGHKQWPELTHLAFSGGSSMPMKTEVFIPPLLPGQVGFATAHFHLPNFPGEYEARFRLKGPHGEQFGDGAGVGCMTQIRVLPPEGLDEKALPKEPTYEKESEDIQSAGYRDRELVEHLLKINNGDVGVCLKWLDENIGLESGDSCDTDSKMSVRAS